MPSPDRVLVIALDSAEPKVVRRLIDRGRMPAVGKILGGGRWTEVESNAGIGSASIWPSFMTGQTPEQHGIYNEWAWDPEKMSARRPHLEGLDPFWRDLERRGFCVGVFDVPFSPHLGLANGFEVNEWGAHDRMRGRMTLSPDGIRKVVEAHPSHPYSSDLPRSTDPNDSDALALIGETAASGIKMRGDLALDLIGRTDPDLAVIAFPELHDAGHFLWHTMEPEHPVFSGAAFTRPPTRPSIEDLYEAVDDQIGRLVQAWGDDGSVAVISLHGMRPGVGWPTLLSPILQRAGLMKPATAADRSLRDNLIALFAALKRRAPKRLSRLYRRKAGTALRIRMARSTMIAAPDWARTKAFPVMADHAGFTRVNLRGREREGIVPLEEHERICDDVIRAARALETDDGKRLLDEVVRPRDVDVITTFLPDLVLHWTDEAFRFDRPYVDGEQLPVPLFPGRTGRHSAHGLCISNGAIASGLGATVTTEDLHRSFVAALAGRVATDDDQASRS